VNTEIHQLDITKYIVDFGFRASVWTEYGGSPASGRTSSYHMSSRIAHLSTYLSGRRAFFRGRCCTDQGADFKPSPAMRH
jgi:hypothetical protein